MQLEHLKNFLVIADSESISHAARRLFLAQSALSAQLKALEREFGAPLFHRDTHRLELTDSGTQLLAYAKKITETADLAKSAVRATAKGQLGTLRLATVPSAVTGLLLPVLSDFRRTHPNVGFRLYEGNFAEVLDRVKDGVCDLGLVRTPFRNGGAFDVNCLTEDPMSAVYRTDVFLLPETPTLADLFSHPIVTLSRYLDLFQAVAARKGLRPEPVAECNEISTALSLARMGLGIALVPGEIPLPDREESLRVIGLEEPELVTSFLLIRLRGTPLPPLAEAFARRMCK